MGDRTMGREVNRVPLDFDWPIKTIWSGFLMPESLHSLPCEACGQTGLSPAARNLKDQWYGNAPFRPEDRGSVPLTPSHPRVRAFAERNVRQSPDYYGSGEIAIVREAMRLCRHWNASWSHHLNQADVDALVSADRLADLTSTFEAGKGWTKTGHHPSAREVNDWSIGGMGHDSINQHIVVEAECERLGIERLCGVCEGEGETFRDDAHRAAYEAWEPASLPTGEGWQMWETTSEGSPISPVFDTPEALAKWLADTGASSFGSDTASYDQWHKMIVGTGWAMSAVSTGGKFMSGVEFVAENPHD
jgi:hypothetical protein